MLWPGLPPASVCAGTRPEIKADGIGLAFLLILGSVGKVTASRVHLT